MDFYHSLAAFLVDAHLPESRRCDPHKTRPITEYPNSSIYFPTTLQLIWQAIAFIGLAVLSILVHRLLAFFFIQILLPFVSLINAQGMLDIVGFQGQVK